MAKKPKIRWRNKDVKELQRLVKNFNAKVTRAEKKNLEKANLLPEKLSVKELQRDILTRQELNREISRINRFLKRGSETIVTTPAGYELTKFSIEQTKEETRIANIIKAFDRKKLEITAEKGVEGERKKLALEPKKFRFGKTQEEFFKFAETVERQLRSSYTTKALERYKQNYLKGLLQIGADKRKQIFKLIENMDARELFELTVGNAKLLIDFMYDEDQSEETRGNQILAEFEFQLS